MPYYATAAATALVLAGFAYRRNVNPHDWARDEAEERMRRCVVCDGTSRTKRGRGGADLPLVCRGPPARPLPSPLRQRWALRPL
jgi:hypothetical protein